MMPMKTILVVADNSGAKRAKCIKILGGSNHMSTKVGDIVVVSIVEVSPTSKIKKGSVAKGVIIRTKSTIKRPDGSIIVFDDNAIVLVDKDGVPIATRVFGPVSREVRQNNFLKIASLASEVI